MNSSIIFSCRFQLLLFKLVNFFSFNNIFEFIVFIFGSEGISVIFQKLKFTEELVFNWI
jgi:hypothetical protein